MFDLEVLLNNMNGVVDRLEDEIRERNILLVTCRNYLFEHRMTEEADDLVTAINMVVFKKRYKKRAVTNDKRP